MTGVLLYELPTDKISVDEVYDIAAAGAELSYAKAGLSYLIQDELVMSLFYKDIQNMMTQHLEGKSLLAVYQVDDERIGVAFALEDTHKGVRIKHPLVNHNDKEVVKRVTAELLDKFYLEFVGYDFFGYLLKDNDKALRLFQSILADMVEIVPAGDKRERRYTRHCLTEKAYPEKWQMIIFENNYHIMQQNLHLPLKRDTQRIIPGQEDVTAKAKGTKGLIPSELLNYEYESFKNDYLPSLYQDDSVPDIWSDLVNSPTTFALIKEIASMTSSIGVLLNSNGTPCGTCWVFDEGRVVTARHVFTKNTIVGVTFDNCFYSHEEDSYYEVITENAEPRGKDLVILAVKELDRKPLPVVPIEHLRGDWEHIEQWFKSGKKAKKNIAIVGYPQGVSATFPEEVKKIFPGIDMKVIQFMTLGMLISAYETFNKDEIAFCRDEYLYHYANTLPCSSGSPIFHLSKDTFGVIGIHTGGDIFDTKGNPRSNFGEWASLLTVPEDDDRYSSYEQ